MGDDFKCSCPPWMLHFRSEFMRRGHWDGGCAKWCQTHLPQSALDRFRPVGEVLSDNERAYRIANPCKFCSFTGPGLDGVVVKSSPVPVVVEPAPVRYGYTGGNVA